MTANDLLAKVRPGSRVTILVPAGRHIDRATGKLETEYKRASGRAVMRGTCGWVLNMGGPHGTPGIADAENIVAVGKAPGAK